MKKLFAILMAVSIIMLTSVMLAGCDAATVSDELGKTDTAAPVISEEDIEDKVRADVNESGKGTFEADSSLISADGDTPDNPPISSSPVDKPTSKATPRPSSDATPKPSSAATPRPSSGATPKPTSEATPKPQEPTSLAAPKISINPSASTRDPITVTITLPDGATRVDYTIDSGSGWRKYDGSFTVNKNCTISARASTHTTVSSVTTLKITNFDSSPVPTEALVAIDAGSSYKNSVAKVLNDAKEEAGLGSFSVSTGGTPQSDAEKKVVDPNHGMSSISCMISGNYSSGSSAGRKVLSLTPDIINYSNIKIGAAYSSTDNHYVVVVGFW